MDNNTQHRYIVPGLVRGLAILQAFSANERELGISEIARKIDTTRSTAFRLVYTLENLGFLEKVGDTKRYRVGARVLELGFSFLSGLDMVELAEPILAELRDNTKTSSHLIIRNRAEVVYVARCNSRMLFASTVSVGTRLPAHATAPGRVLLCRLSPTEVATVMGESAMKQFTDQTPTSVAALNEMLAVDRQHNAVVSWGYFEPSVQSIAAPVFDRNGTVAAALSVSCPMGTYPRDIFSGEIQSQVEASAAALSRALGFSGPG